MNTNLELTENKFLLDIVINVKYLLIILILFSSCNRLPDDLKEKNISLNNRYNSIVENKGTPSFQYELLLQLQTEVNEHIEECSRRGITNKKNNILLKNIYEEMTKYEVLLDKDKPQSTNNSNIEKRIDAFSGRACVNCNLDVYNDRGFCNFCGAASPSRTQASYDNAMVTCPGCNGAGSWPGYPNPKVCGICNGAGKYLPY